MNSLLTKRRLVVAFLRPRVGKIDVVSPDGVGRQEEFDELSGIRPRQPDIAELALQTSLVGNPQVLARPLDAEIVRAPVALSGIDQETPLPDSQLDLYLVGIAEQVLKVEDGIAVAPLLEIENQVFNLPGHLAPSDRQGLP